MTGDRQNAVEKALQVQATAGGRTDGERWEALDVLAAEVKRLQPIEARAKHYAQVRYKPSEAGWSPGKVGRDILGVTLADVLRELAAAKESPTAG